MLKAVASLPLHPNHLLSLSFSVQNLIKQEGWREGKLSDP